MKLIVLPDDGLAPILAAIRCASASIRVTIFRSNLPELEKALRDAVTRGVRVHALIAHTNRAGEKLLRDLELRLLGHGVTVSRTADDLIRYHDKLLIIDETLYVMGFNFTRVQVSRCRSLAVVTRKERLVSEAAELFDADVARRPFTPKSDELVVSPLNARARLAALLSGARRSLRIYDSKVLDRQMLRMIRERASAGVDVRVIGTVGASGRELKAAPLTTLRLHLRAILSDESVLFVGSQSLRPLELDRRREVGILVRDKSVIRQFRDIFEADWATTAIGRQEIKEFEADQAIQASAAVVSESIAS
jgi:phosphatidylserine/phosphatidylglycerophosphate/cardiolipin synthase-like enzyme